MFEFMFSHVNDLLSVINLLPTAKKILDTATSNKGIVETITKIVPQLAPVLEALGSRVFPKVAPELHIAAGLMMAYDQDKTIWLQQSVNALLPDEQDIKVDGVYGPATRDAVEKVQAQIPGLKVDGWAGKVTQAAIEFALNALFGHDTPTAQAPANAQPPATMSMHQLSAPSVTEEIQTTF